MAEFTVRKHNPGKVNDVPSNHGRDTEVRMAITTNAHKVWYMSREEALQLSIALTDYLRDTREKALSEVNHEGHC